ncbi:hypothetical protein GP486_007211 [Trichoglossum hirsutum]|uniref:Uncharacterized protein n=1 Tax=Trichoglossum hirsutum TaxID=265104 RepID=A0A9P8IHT3_9PEZI|nr:hypothetical protein GP486_007211 [Trichoglossum hirsutum]
MSRPIVEDDRADSLGQVISLEGDIQTIITQLRLLPPSPRVLTLPPFSRSLSQAPVESESDARRFILHAHRNFSQRCEQARNFLLSSPGDQPRLVLMNGGCVSAKRICISKIAEELAGGNVEEGEQIFNELVSRGVAGLEEPKTMAATATKTAMPPPPPPPLLPPLPPPPPALIAAPEPVDVHAAHDEPGRRPDPGRSFERPRRYVEGEYDELVQSPLNNHFLDPSAEDYALEPPRHFLKPFAVQTATSSIYSQENPLYDDPSAGGDPHRSENRPTTPRSRRQSYRRPSFADADRMPIDYRREPAFVRAAGGDDPGGEMQKEADGVVYGKAYAVSLNSSGSAENTPRKVRSIPELGNKDKASRHRAKTLQHVRSLEQMENKNRNRAATVVPISPVSPVSPISPVFPHKTTQCGESDTGSYDAGPGKTLPYAAHVDQGTDAGVQLRSSKDAGAQANLVEPSARPLEELPFEPVFPLVEDLVITFLDGNLHHELFESVIQSYKSGSYPPHPANALPYHVAGAQRGQTLSDGVRLTRYSIMTVDTDVELIVHSNGNYSHYRDSSLASNANSTAPKWPKRKASLTNSPKLISNAQRFLEFYPRNFKTCLGAQDAFRLMLSGNIPTMSLDNVPITSPLQVYGSWKPVLRIDHGLDSRGRTVDQILAVGHEDGVHKDMYQAIVGQIERLGTKKSGLSKSSHVDARYLVSNALQSIAQQSPIDDRTANPIAYPAVLAETLVPQIESYLAANESTRLLIIKFDPTMAQTMIELRRIFGEDIFKIATITKSSQDSSLPTMLSTAASDNGHSTAAKTRRLEKLDRFFGETVRTPGSSNSSTASRPSTSSSRRPLLPSSNPPSETDFTLSCSANNFETGEFLDNIRDALISKNHFFEHEHNGSSPPPSRRAPSSIRSMKVHTPPPVVYPPPVLPPPLPQSLPPLPVLGGARPATASEEKWRGFFDSEEDEIDRVMMPVVTRKIQGKNNSRKAMKWLGLS